MYVNVQYFSVFTYIILLSIFIYEISINDTFGTSLAFHIIVLERLGKYNFSTTQQLGPTSEQMHLVPWIFFKTLLYSIHLNY